MPLIRGKSMENLIKSVILEKNGGAVCCRCMMIIYYNSCVNMNLNSHDKRPICFSLFLLLLFSSGMHIEIIKIKSNQWLHISAIRGFLSFVIGVPYK